MGEGTLGHLGWLEDVDQGRVVACRKIRLVARRMLGDLEHPGRWHYDAESAANHVDFIESFCCHPSGDLEPLVLEPFQRAIIACVFGFVDDDGRRRYQEVLVVMARKNGKSTLASAIELDMLLNPTEGEWAPSIYNVATAKDQANLCFDSCLTMLSSSPVLRRHARKRAWDIFCPANRGTIKALAANTNSLDGLNVQLAVIDELSAIKNRDLYDLVSQGTSSRTQPLLLEITTNGFVRHGIFDSQYQYASDWLEGRLKGEKADRFLPFVFELDERGEWEDEGAWPKANPGLGTIKRVDALRANVSKARDDPSYLPTVLVKDFDLVENSSTAWLAYDELHNDETFDLDAMGFRYAVVGFDASDSVDLTAACALMMRPGDPKVYELHMAWIPQSVIDEQAASGDRHGRDFVPYDAWISRGLMRVVPGNIIDKRCLLDWLSELRDEHDVYSFALGYDPWHVDVPTLKEFQAFFGERNCHAIRQGAKTLSQPMKELRERYRSNEMVDGANPIAEWCRSNVMVRSDVNGNIQPDKKDLDSRNRIDAFAAELDAYVTLLDVADEYQQII